MEEPEGEGRERPPSPPGPAGPAASRSGPARGARLPFGLAPVRPRPAVPASAPTPSPPGPGVCLAPHPRQPPPARSPAPPLPSPAPRGCPWPLLASAVPWGPTSSPVTPCASLRSAPRFCCHLAGALSPAPGWACPVVLPPGLSHPQELSLEDLRVLLGDPAYTPVRGGTAAPRSSPRTSLHLPGGPSSPSRGCSWPGLWPCSPCVHRAGLLPRSAFAPDLPASLPPCSAPHPTSVPAGPPSQLAFPASSPFKVPACPLPNRPELTHSSLAGVRVRAVFSGLL